MISPPCHLFYGLPDAMSAIRLPPARRQLIFRRRSLAMRRRAAARMAQHVQRDGDTAIARQSQRAIFAALLLSRLSPDYAHHRRLTAMLTRAMLPPLLPLTFSPCRPPTLTPRQLSPDCRRCLMPPIRLPLRFSFHAAADAVSYRDFSAADILPPCHDRLLPLLRRHAFVTLPLPPRFTPLRLDSDRAFAFASRYAFDAAACRFSHCRYAPYGRRHTRCATSLFAAAAACARAAREALTLFSLS